MKNDFYYTFVKDDKNIIDMVAFGIYKTDERAFIKKYFPSDDEFRNYQLEGMKKRVRYYATANALIQEILLLKLSELQDFHDIDPFK